MLDGHGSMLPTPDEWIAWAKADPHMKAVSRGEWAGPCPSCKGTDRFRVNKAGAFCRICCPDGSAGYRDAYREACRAAGFLIESPETVRSRPAPRPRPAPAPKPEPEPESWSQQQVRTILARAAGPVDTPAERYLIERHVWPPDNRAPPVKWIGVRAFPHELPSGAAGAIVFPLIGKDGPAPACQWQAVTADGKGLLHKDRKRITYGEAKSKNRVFYGNRPSYDPPPVTIVCEGPIDALAAYWMHKWSRALIVGSAGELGNFPLWPIPSGVPVIIEAHGDPAGKKASVLRARLQAAGWAASVNHRKRGDPKDVAEELEIAILRDGWEPRLRKEST
ncbi:MAG: hypothetical protein OXH76_20810 [Boseongicola sp.]|nr:hypothetical protein [Boseongicola sp.]